MSHEARPARSERGDDHPLVSIGMPTFNRASRLPAAVQTVLDQDHPNIELIISDNGSTDGTAEFCEALAGREPRVRYLRSSENVGPTANFNRVRDAATGEFFMWLGDSDRIDPSYVRRCVETLRDEPELALATGRVEYHQDGQLVAEGLRVEPHDPRPSTRVLEYYRVARDNGTFYGVTPRWVVDTTDPLRPEIGTDLYLLGAMAYLGPFRTVDDVVLRRSRGGSTSSMRNVARVAGYSRLVGLLPQVAMTWYVFADVGWRGSVYRELARAQRLALGARCAGIFVWRFIVLNVPTHARRRLAAVRESRRRRSRDR